MEKNYLIGYETLLVDFKRYQKQTPKGVSMSRKNGNIYFKFTVGSKRGEYACNCSFTLDGMVSALSKAHKVADALKQFTSESEFWDWYDKEIKEVGKIENDLLTFRDVIAVVEDDFWNRNDRRKQKRDKDNPSDLSSWNDTYWRFYKHLPSLDKAVNLKDIQTTLERWKKGSKSYKSAVSVFKKLARVANKDSIIESLDKLDVTQTQFKELQSATLEDFFEWRDRTLGITVELDPRCNLDIRKAWLWVFSIQVVYGLRIHETFAIQNLDKPFTTKDKVIIPALNDASNSQNLIVIGEKTVIETKTKTHYRLARPLLPSKYPDLIERLEIKKPLLPSNKPDSNNFDAIRKFYCNTAIRQLIRWNAPFTQTHALRHLANLNGMQAGISLEVRAQSLGHSPTMNDTIYKKRQHTKTTIDILLDSNKQAIDFTSGLLEAKQIIKKYPNSSVAVVELISKIYQKSEYEIEELLN